MASTIICRWLEANAARVQGRAISKPDSKTLSLGYYMLFVLTNTGVPSEAIWVFIQ